MEIFLHFLVRRICEKIFFKKNFNFNTSPLWRDDYFDSNDGKIPDEVPQWVLTQDAIFDAIGTEFDLADGYKELIQAIDDKKWKE